MQFKYKMFTLFYIYIINRKHLQNYSIKPQIKNWHSIRFLIISNGRSLIILKVIKNVLNNLINAAL